MFGSPVNLGAIVSFTVKVMRSKLTITRVRMLLLVGATSSKSSQVTFDE